MKLSESQFCVECEELVPLSARACPSCTCTQFYQLLNLADPSTRRQRLRIIEGKRSATLLRFKRLKTRRA